MKKKIKTNVIHIRLDDSSMESLKRIADREQRTLSQLARMILIEAVIRRGVQK